jgi:hypothetical protein
MCAVRGFVACVALALAAGPVAACINDIELPGAEREFRSQYRDAAPAPPPVASPEPARPHAGLLYAGGAVMLLAALRLGFAKPRARS